MIEIASGTRETAVPTAGADYVNKNTKISPGTGRSGRSSIFATQFGCARQVQSRIGVLQRQTRARAGALSPYRSRHREDL